MKTYKVKFKDKNYLVKAENETEAARKVIDSKRVNDAINYKVGTKFKSRMHGDEKNINTIKYIGEMGRHKIVEYKVEAPGKGAMPLFSSSAIDYKSDFEERLNRGTYKIIN